MHFILLHVLVHASDDRLLKMRIDHHNQQPFGLINRLFWIIGTSLLLTLRKSLVQFCPALSRRFSTVTDVRVSNQTENNVFTKYYSALWQKPFK